MASNRTHSGKKTGLIALLMALVLVITAIGTLAFFSDRVTDDMTVTTATFTKDGYTLKTEHLDGPFIANEDVKVTLKESSVEATESVITMSVKWTSPDPDCKIFGHATAADNATITIGGQTIAITGDMISADKSTVTFKLPAHALDAGATDKARELLIHIPNSLMGTGQISVTVDKVELQQTPNGFTTEIGAAELTEHNFTVDVGWAASALSANNGKNLMGYLVAGDTAGEYKIQYKFEFGCTSSAMKDFATRTDARWSHYKDSVTDLLFIEGMTSIGDYAFPDFSKVTAVSFPTTVADIGISAFDNSGLTGEVTIPATVKNIESLAFGNLEAVNEFTFGHTSNTLTLPDNTSEGKTNKGAFYVSSHVDTTVNSSVAEIMYGYRWHDGFDNRRLVPTLSEDDTWQYTTYWGDTDDYSYVTPIDLDTLTTIDIVDYYMPDASETAWDVSDSSVPGTVTAYLSADKTKVTIAGNGYGSIFANEYSNSTFSFYNNYYSFPELTRINGADLLDVSNVVEARDMFANNGKLEHLNVSNWDTGNIRYTSSSYYSGMFSYCSNLPELDVSAWDTSSMEDMTLMFAGCRSLTTLDVSNWNTSACESTMDMFSDCSSLTELSVNTKQVNVGTPEEYTAWDISNVENAAGMFEGTTGLKTVYVKDWNTAKIWSMRRMFYGSGIESLDLSGWNESTVTNVEGMFETCANLKNINLNGWNLSKVTDSGTMLRFCTSLESVTFPASLVNYGSFFADGCTNLTTIEFLHAKDTDITFHNASGGYGGAFPLSDPYSGANPLRTKVITANTDVLSYGWANDYRGYVVTVSAATGGTVTADPAVAINGKTVTLTPAPNSGYGYDGATVTYTDEAGVAQTINLDAATTTFTMPVADVSVTPKWVSTVVLERIAVTTPPNTTDYDEGMDFSRDGMVVTAYYSDGAEKVVTDYTIADETNLTRTQSELTISYTDGSVTSSASQAIRVFVPITINSTNRGDYGYDEASTTLVVPDPFKEDGVWYKVARIDRYAFSKCTNLQSVVLPDSLTEIGQGAFSTCSNLQNIKFGSGLLDIETQAFWNCTSLQSVVFPDSPIAIWQSAFSGCTSLQSIDFGTGVESISQQAFQGCTSLQSIEIPASVTSIGTSAFGSCSNLTGIWVDSDNTAYSNDTYGVLFNKNKSSLLQFIQTHTGSYVVPDSVTSIGESAFSGCSNLSSIEFISNVNSIGKLAFNGCTSLQSIELPDSVTSIGASAFNNCSGLTSITIPAGVSTIEKSTFAECTSLSSAKIPVSVTKINSSAFNYCISFTTVYYSGTEEQWNAITITTTNNEYLTAATKYYNQTW